MTNVREIQIAAAPPSLEEFNALQKEIQEGEARVAKAYNEYMEVITPQFECQNINNCAVNSPWYLQYPRPLPLPEHPDKKSLQDANKSLACEPKHIGCGVIGCLICSSPAVTLALTTKIYSILAVLLPSCIYSTCKICSNEEKEELSEAITNQIKQLSKHENMSRFFPSPEKKEEENKTAEGLVIRTFQ